MECKSIWFITYLSIQEKVRKNAIHKTHKHTNINKHVRTDSKRKLICYWEEKDLDICAYVYVTGFGSCRQRPCSLQLSVQLAAVVFCTLHTAPLGCSLSIVTGKGTAAATPIQLQWWDLLGLAVCCPLQHPGRINA